MKSKEQVIAELYKQYGHRLNLRLERKLKNCCRNCRKHKVIEVNAGELGRHERYVCGAGLVETQPCKSFDCLYTKESIEQELLADMKDPAVCGAKEPKLAALQWVLHDDPKDK